MFLLFYFALLYLNLFLIQLYPYLSVYSLHMLICVCLHVNLYPYLSVFSMYMFICFVYSMLSASIKTSCSYNSIHIFHYFPCTCLYVSFTLLSASLKTSCSYNSIHMKHLGRDCEPYQFKCQTNLDDWLHTKLYCIWY